MNTKNNLLGDELVADIYKKYDDGADEYKPTPSDNRNFLLLVIVSLLMWFS